MRIQESDGEEVENGDSEMRSIDTRVRNGLEVCWLGVLISVSACVW